MNRDRKVVALVSLGAFLLSTALPVFAQQRKPAPDDNVTFQKPVPAPKEPTGDVMIFQGEKVPGPDIAQRGEDTFFFITAEMSFDGKLVKGAPYSAEAVTEMTQTLSDGNRIVNKSTALLYRDSEGRTRRDQALRAIGPFATGTEPPQTIVISDPVAGANYMLDPRTKVARKTLPMRIEFKVRTATGPDGSVITENIEGPKETREAEVSGVLRAKVHEGVVMKEAVGMGAVGVGPAGGFAMEYHGDKKNARKESLGEQLVDGVKAEGTRTTITIAAGEIGNERPIEMIMERWYSPELQTVVMTRHTDPRFGETVYKLININRTEPARSLFEVPGDYTIKETPAAPGAPMHMRTHKPPIEE